MAALALQMPPDPEMQAKLATKSSLDSAPAWSVAHATDFATPAGTPNFELKGNRTKKHIFRLPNLNPTLRNWLYTRPTTAAVPEDAFKCYGAESWTIYRMENVDKEIGTVFITPTVSNHWLLVPCQTIDGFTIGLVYLHVTYERPTDDNRVPPVRVGCFVLENSSGELFVTGWSGEHMVVGWYESILKCERVHELFKFQAPSNGMEPQNLLVRNSFYERRACHLCGHGPSVTMLPEPCSRVGDPIRSNSLFDVSRLYKLFRGHYFGLCLKTKFGNNRALSQESVGIIIDLRLSPQSIRQQFTANLKRNIAVVGPDCYFGVGPRCSENLARSYYVRTLPVDSLKSQTPLQICGNQVATKRKLGESSISAIPTIMKNTNRNDPKKRRRRRRVEDPGDRNSAAYLRVKRNRESASKSNLRRKQKLEQTRAELNHLQKRVPELKAEEVRLQEENAYLRNAVEFQRLQQPVPSLDVNLLDEPWLQSFFEDATFLFDFQQGVQV